MSWTCEQIETSLSDYLDGLLSPADREAFLAHASSCAQCAPLVTSLPQLLAGLHALAPVETPPHLVYNILDKTLGPRESSSAWRFFRDFLRGLASPKFAYGAASVLATLAVVLTAAGFSWRKPRLADLHPVTIYRSADRQAHLAYARGSKFISDLRVVYEIQSRLRPDTENPAAPENSAPPSAPPSGPDDQPGISNAPRHFNRTYGNRPGLTVLATTLTPFSQLAASRSRMQRSLP